MFTLPGTPATGADLSARRRVFVPVYTSASLVEVLCPYGHELRHGGRGEKNPVLVPDPEGRRTSSEPEGIFKTLSSVTTE